MLKKKYGMVNVLILIWVNVEYFLNDIEIVNVNIFVVLLNISIRWCIIDIMDRDICVNCKDMLKII